MRFTMGPSIRHGPHHAAVRSRRKVSCEPLTSVSKLRSLISSTFALAMIRSLERTQGKVARGEVLTSILVCKIDLTQHLPQEEPCKAPPKTTSSIG